MNFPKERAKYQRVSIQEKLDRLYAKFKEKEKVLKQRLDEENKKKISGLLPDLEELKRALADNPTISEADKEILLEIFKKYNLKKLVKFLAD
jgi:hypothetical protein